MASGFGTIPDGCDVVIDTNIFVYGLTGKSVQCKEFLARCSREEVTGISLFEVVHDATHVFMRAEALEKGFFTAEEKGAKYLASHPEKVKLQQDYWVNTLRLLALNIVLLPMEQNILSKAQAERVAAGLLTNDSIIVGAMREYGIPYIATSDKIFDSVAGISVFSPTDV